MSDAPHYEIDPRAFYDDPYPDLKAMRELSPVVFVPQLRANLITRRDDIATVERQIEYFSSVAPNGLMTRMMGQNMMRKDGDDHMSERKAIFPSVSPKAVREVWKNEFISFTDEILDEIRPLGRADMALDIAKRLSGEALKVVTGLRNMTWQEMDRVSQGMIDACANHAGDPVVFDNCRNCTASIDRHIDGMIPVVTESPDLSLLSVQMQAGLSDEQIRANIRLAISGGQNEPRDVIAGMVWALLNHPKQLKLVLDGEVSWLKAFREYTRWISPIGMSPRVMAQPFELHGITLEPKDDVFLMFGSANRDPDSFDRPEEFDVTQDNAASIAFGAGPHFCAGAKISQCLISEVVMPAIFRKLPGLRLDGETRFGGWGFRGPLVSPVAWDT